MPAARPYTPTDAIAVPDTEAARMFRLRPAEFRELVAQGALPPPRRIGPYERWSVRELDAILSGDAAKPKDDFE